MFEISNLQFWMTKLGQGTGDASRRFLAVEENCPGSGAERDRMELTALLVMLIVGAVAGWLAGLIVKGYGFGVLGNIVVGIVGALIAGLLLPNMGLSFGGGLLGSILAATLGAVILLLLIRVIKRA